jgi:ABC-type polysaccharide/polyol phosphate transport system ATPase subunit
MTTPAIRVQGLSKTFRIPHVQYQSLRGRILHPFAKTVVEEFDALEDVNFEVEHGEFFGIVGRNGSGKSTLLKILAGIYRPDAGTVAVAGSVAPFIELGVGFNPELSGRDNVFINGALLGLSSARIRQRYEAIVAFAELERFMDLRLRNFSSGMQVRLAFAIALEAGADILLTDEVLAVGDENFQRKCFEVFRQRKAEGRTVVFVTHDMGAILDFCDRTLLLDHGKVVELGDTREVVRAYHRLNAAGDGTAVDSAKPDDQPAVEAERPASIHTVEIVGNGAAVEGGTVDPGQRIGIRVVATVECELHDPIIGLIITDHLGKQVLLTNTHWSGVEVGRCAAGSEVAVTFGFDNVLAAGDFVVQAEIAHAGPGPIIHADREALRFSVRSDLQTGGVVDLPVTIDVASTTPQGESARS